MATALATQTTAGQNWKRWANTSTVIAPLQLVARVERPAVARV
jgi:hypothetical protein